jgi:endonuclease/exonuclease/phosphatase family metal-dependent hydrolase
MASGTRRRFARLTPLQCNSVDEGTAAGSTRGMRDLRVLSYNVRYFGHSTRGLASTPKAMKRIADAIAALDPVPDLLCLQEVETQSLRSTIAHPVTHPDETQLDRFSVMLSASLATAGKARAFAPYYFPAHSYRIAKGAEVYTTGVAVLVGETLTVEGHNAKEPADVTHRRPYAIRRLKQTRVCAHLRLRERDGSGAPFDLFNTHLSLPAAFAKEFWTKPRRLGWGKNQLEEAKNMARFVEQVANDERFFVVGDFNALPDSPVYEHLACDAGLTDALAKVKKMSIDDLVEWPTAGFMRLRMHLDHVFSGGGVAWLDFDASAPFGDRASPFYGLSDHVPLIGRFRVQP